MQPIQIRFRDAEQGETIVIGTGEFAGEPFAKFDRINGRYVVVCAHMLVHQTTSYFDSYKAAMHQCMAHAYEYVAMKYEERFQEVHKGENND